MTYHYYHLSLKIPTGFRSYTKDWPFVVRHFTFTDHLFTFQQVRLRCVFEFEVSTKEVKERLETYCHLNLFY